MFSGFASAISIYPIPVELRPDRKIAIVTLDVTEDIEKEKIFEAFLYEWDVEKGETVATSDALIYPKTTKLPATFKVAFKKPLNRKTEKAYRILIKEVPFVKHNGEQKEVPFVKHNGEQQGIRFVLAYDIPLFIIPSGEKIDFVVDCNKEGAVVKNRGNRTLKINEIDGKGVVIYVAPGKEKSVSGKRIKIFEKVHCNIGGEISL